jgi:predicted ABC-type sugar transport system permease subunit
MVGRLEPLIVEYLNGRFRRIVFSNVSRAAARLWAISALLGVCVLYVLMWHLMGSAGCRAARLKSQSANLAACYTIGAVICSLPRASLRSGAWFDLLWLALPG